MAAAVDWGKTYCIFLPVTVLQNWLHSIAHLNTAMLLLMKLLYKKSVFWVSLARIALMSCTMGMSDYTGFASLAFSLQPPRPPPSQMSYRRPAWNSLNAVKCTSLEFFSPILFQFWFTHNSELLYILFYIKYILNFLWESQHALTSHRVVVWGFRLSLRDQEALEGFILEGIGFWWWHVPEPTPPSPTPPTPVALT